MVVKIVNYTKMRPVVTEMSSVWKTLSECGSRPHQASPAYRRQMVVTGKSFVSFLRNKRRDASFLLAKQPFKGFVEVSSNESWCSKSVYLPDIFHELNFLNNDMQVTNENILTSRDKYTLFRKNWQFGRHMQLRQTWKYFLLLLKKIIITTFCHLSWITSMLCQIFSADIYWPVQYGWVRNLFVESEPSEWQFILAEGEELASFASDRTLMLKRSELNLDSFWMLVEQEFPAISQMALRLLTQFQNSYLCECGFSAMTTIKQARTTAVCRKTSGVSV